jgi:hypothetical protein
MKRFLLLLLLPIALLAWILTTDAYEAHPRSYYDD